MKAEEIICGVIGALLGALLSWSVMSSDLADAKSTISKMNIERETDARKTKQAELERLQRANDLANSLENQLAVATQNLENKETELQRAIKANTDGRACLSGRLVRMLNTGSSAAVVPAPASGPAATGSATTADTDYEEAATDEDVAAWANTVKRLYGVCAEKLDKLIKFNEGVK